MSDYLSASGIVQNFSLVFWLYGHSNDPPYSADIRCRQFGSSIRGLAEAVTGLEGRVQRHRRPPNGVHCVTYGSTTDQYDPALHWSAIDAIKEFKATLVDCETFLARHSLLQKDRSGFIQNISWSASSQSLVDELQMRIANQVQQIAVLMAPITLRADQRGPDQLSCIVPARNEPLAIEILSVDQFPMPDAVSDRFKYASNRDPPPDYRSPNDFPLERGFEALWAHFQQSTRQSSIGSPQSIHQYVSLLKSQWILQAMKRVPEFAALRPWSKDKNDLQELENQIVLELSRPELTIWQSTDILRLPDSHFFIWNTRPLNVQQDIMQPLQGEKEILRASLPVPPGYVLYELVVFRNTIAKSGTGVRVVRKFTASDPIMSPSPEEQVFDSFKDEIIPLYALRRSRDVSCSLELRSQGFTKGKIYDFDGLADVFKLQWALTCFEVVSDSEKVNWTIAKPFLLDAKLPRGEKSRVQIWMWDPHGLLALVAAGPDGHTDGHSGSLVSHLTSQSALSILDSSNDMEVEIQTGPEKKSSNAEVVEAVMSYEPLLIIHTEDAKNKLCYICIKLTGDILIDPTKCPGDCRKKTKTCKRTVIRAKSGSIFIRQINLKKGSKGIPNLSVFARSFRKNQAEHADLRDEQCVTEFKGDHFVLDFGSADARERFNGHFQLARKLRLSLESKYSILEKRAEFVSNKPEGHRPEGHSNPRDRILGGLGSRRHDPFAPASPPAQSSHMGRSSRGVDQVSSRLSAGRGSSAASPDLAIHPAYMSPASSNISQTSQNEPQELGPRSPQELEGHMWGFDPGGNTQPRHNSSPPRNASRENYPTTAGRNGGDSSGFYTQGRY